MICDGFFCSVGLESFLLISKNVFWARLFTFLPWLYGSSYDLIFSVHLCRRAAVDTTRLLKRCRAVVVSQKNLNLDGYLQEVDRRAVASSSTDRKDSDGHFF